MTYSCDVFISYRNAGEAGAWVKHTLLPLLRDALHEEGEPDPKLFVDSDAIQAGDAWPAHISAAHYGAKVHLLVVSGAYWTRSWCVTEAVGALLLATKRPSPPSVFIVRFNDLERSSEAAAELNNRVPDLQPALAERVHEIQALDLERFNVLDQRYHRESRDFPDLHRAVRELGKAMRPSLKTPRSLDSPVPPIPPVVAPDVSWFSASLGGRR
jgi:hypothetical protein